MKNFFLSASLVLTLFSGLTFAQATRTQAITKAESKQAIEVPFVNKTLANGLEVIVLPDKSVPLVTVEIAVRNGSFTEPLEFNGLSHLYEHMFFKPSKAVNLFLCEEYTKYLSSDPRAVEAYRRASCSEVLPFKKQIGDVSYLTKVDSIGLARNATTQEEVVNYFFTGTTPHTPTIIEFISDAIRFPNFTEEELEKEIRVVIGEIDRNEANPFFYLQNEIKERLYYKYPTRKKPLGTRETVMSATVEKMKQIQSRYYVPNNTALIVTGDVNPAEVFRLAEKNLGDWEKRPVDPFKEFPLIDHPPLEKSNGVIVNKDVQNVLIQIGWHGPSIGVDNDGTYAADVFSYILEQPDSKFQRALIDTGLVTGVGLNYYTQRNVGPISLLISTTPEKAKEALAAVYKQIEQFDKPDYYTDQELENSKNLLEARDLFEREKLSNYSHTLAFWWSTTGIDYFRDYHKNLRAVSRKDINTYIQRYIKNKPHVAVALISEDSQKAAGLTEADLIGK